MRRRRIPAASYLLMATVLSAVLACGCSAFRTSAADSSGTGKGVPPHGAAQVPDEFEVNLTLRPGQSWKSRFTSNSEIRRTLTGPDGKESVRSRSVGLELVATQTVTELAGGVARIEVREASIRILQEGKLVDAPFLQFAPPNPVAFTLDTRTGKADFSEMEKAYEEWMAEVRLGPAGDILGKTFRVDSYVAQLKELYGKPFTRHAGRKYAKGIRSTEDKDFVFPFLGPAAALGPVPVQVRTWYEGFRVKNGEHVLSLKGQYEGERDWTAEDVAGRLADFGVPAPQVFLSSGAIEGRFESGVDVLSGREVRSTSRLAYNSSASFGGAALKEEIKGASTIEPAN